MACVPRITGPHFVATDASSRACHRRGAAAGDTCAARCSTRGAAGGRAYAGRRGYGCRLFWEKATSHLPSR